MIFRILKAVIAVTTFFVLRVNGEASESETSADETALEKVLTATIAKSANHFCAVLVLLCVCFGILSVSVYKFIKMRCCIEEDKHSLETVNIIRK